MRVASPARSFAWLAGALALATTACSGAPDDVPADCTRDDNALRFNCSAALTRAAPATWTVRRSGAVVRTFVTETTTDPRLTIWSLAPETNYTWEMTAGDEQAAGSFETGRLPEDLADLDIHVSGTPSTSALLMTQGGKTAQYALIVGTDGEVLFYHPLAGRKEVLTGYSFTDEGTIAAVSGGTDVEEFTPEGKELIHASGFDRPVHHDVVRGGDYLYVLNAALHGNKIVDGFYVIDRSGKVIKSFDLADHFALDTPCGENTFWTRRFPGGEDWSHANSIWSDGKVAILSLRWQDAGVAVNADPNDPAFGAVLWVLSGGLSELPSDFTWTGDGGFSRQHEIRPMPGGFSVFDTRAKGVDSLAIELAVDHDKKTVRETHAWNLGEHCEHEGGSFPLPNRGMLATCATTGEVTEYPPGSDTPVWTLHAESDSRELPRAIPVPLP